VVVVVVDGSSSKNSIASVANVVREM
jgi:hypothetical protein